MCIKACVSCHIVWSRKEMLLTEIEKKSTTNAGACRKSACRFGRYVWHFRAKLYRHIDIRRDTDWPSLWNAADDDDGDDAIHTVITSAGGIDDVFIIIDMRNNASSRQSTLVTVLSIFHKLYVIISDRRFYKVAGPLHAAFVHYFCGSVMRWWRRRRRSKNRNIIVCIVLNVMHINATITC